MVDRAPKVSLYLLCKTQEGWKRYPAAIGRNNKVRPGYAQLGAAQKQFEGGKYQLRWVIEGKTFWESVGDDATFARAAQDTKQKTLVAQVAAEDAGAKIVETPGRIDLKKKAKAYVSRQEDRGKAESVLTFNTAIDSFMNSAGVRFADELTEQHITRWYGALRKQGNSPRTIANKHQSVFAFLRWLGIDTKKLAEKRPTFTEKVVEIYSRDEMTVFFGSLTDPYHRMVFEVLLKTGMRMQEAMFMRWTDIDLPQGVIRVKQRDEDGREIKDKEERVVPVPADLLEKLKQWKEQRANTKLVFGTRNDTPNWKWLDLLKRLVKKAELNCGHCEGCVESDQCERWYLHKFRATYLTNMLRAGIDPRTVMSYSGHSDMETLMRYLSPAELPETQEKVNAINFGV